MRAVAFSIALVLGAYFGATSAQAQGSDLDTLFNPQFPGITTVRDGTRDYDEEVFYTGPMTSSFKAGESMTLEGRVRQAVFKVPASRSTLEVFRGYSKGIEGFGFKEIYSCSSRADCNGSIGYVYVKSRTSFPVSNDQRYGLYERTKDGVREVVALFVTKLETGPSDKRVLHVGLDTLTTDAQETALTFLTADDIAAAINETGTAALYGLEFASDSADLLPSSDDTLAEIAGYLTANAAQNVLIVGHTDNVGALEYNTALSLRRARSVVEALSTRYSIAASRLEAHGVGYLAPKASNASDGGRAQNRRVEIVAR